MSQLFVVERYDDTGTPGREQPLPAPPSDVHLVYAVRVPADDVVLALMEGTDERTRQRGVDDGGVAGRPHHPRDLGTARRGRRVMTPRPLRGWSRRSLLLVAVFGVTACTGSTPHASHSSRQHAELDGRTDPGRRHPHVDGHRALLRAQRRHDPGRRLPARRRARRRRGERDRRRPGQRPGVDREGQRTGCAQAGRRQDHGGDGAGHRPRRARPAGGRQRPGDAGAGGAHRRVQDAARRVVVAGHLAVTAGLQLRRFAADVDGR